MEGAKPLVESNPLGLDGRNKALARQAEGGWVELETDLVVSGFGVPLGVGKGAEAGNIPQALR
jgi:hypothetical protein